MKIRKLLFTFALLFSASIFAQIGPIFNGGFEYNTLNSGTDWDNTTGALMPTGVSAPAYNSTYARTGSYYLQHTTVINGASVPTPNASSISVANGDRAFVIGWATGTDLCARASCGGTLNGILNSTPIATITTAFVYQRFTYSVQNVSGNPQTFTPRVNSRRANACTTATVFWDDVIMYSFNAAGPDTVKPITATSFTTGAVLSNSVTFSWTGGSDTGGNNTGIQNTIILRAPSSTVGLPVMNDQGVYSTTGGASGPKKVSTDWDVISTSESAAATSFTDNTVLPGTTYRYAVIHRDLAYNYSPALVSGAVVCPPSLITSAQTGNWSATTTWVGGVVPASNTNVLIESGHIVTIDNASINTRNAGTSTTVNLGGTLATGAFAYNNNGTTTVNGTFQIDTGGSFANAPIYGSSSTLVYNSGGSYIASNEWTGTSATPTAGLGTPQNVTIQNSTTLTMPATNRSMAGDLNITSGSLTLNATSGDLYVAGNWTRASTATFTPNNRAVFFNGSTPQTVTVNPTGTETFNFLLVEGSGTLQLATGTNVVVTASSGLTLTSSNVTSTIDLNGQTLTLSGGGNLNLNTGTRRITSSLANGRLVLSAGTLTITNGGSLSTEANTTVDLRAGLDSGTGSLLTINGTLQINLGGFNLNSPKYGASSLLRYNSGGTYSRGFEWLANGVGTIGTTAGYPNNVQLSNNTTFDYNNGNPANKAMNGSLTIDSGSTFNMTDTTNGTPSAGTLTIAGSVINNGTFTFANVATPVVVAGNYTNAGTTTMGSVSGAELRVGGDFTNTGTFNGNARAVFFTKTGTQVVTSSSTLTIPYLVTTGTGTIVKLATGTNLILSAPNTGNAVSFGNLNDVIDINGNSLTIGTASTANVINGSGTFKGSTDSNLTLLGTGSIGTLNFTSGSQNLGTFTMNRQSSVVGCVLGTPLTVNASLALTNGHIDLGTNNLTLGASATTTLNATPSNSFVLAFGTTGGQLIKTFSSAPVTPFTYPIGDNIGTLQYSPANLIFAGGTYPGSFGVRVVDSAHPSNAGVDNLSRYWQVLDSGIAPTSYTFAGTYITGAEDVTGAESNCFPQRWNGSAWTDIGGTAIGSNTCTVSGSSLNSINEFSAQTATLYYQSRASGDWSSASTWQTSLDNVTWSTAVAAPTIAANTITVLTGHTVTITSAVTFDQVYVTGNLNVTGASYAVTINNGTGVDLTINNGGIVSMSMGTGTATDGWGVSGLPNLVSIAVLSGGTYVHNSPRAVSAFLDKTTFDPNSTMIYLRSISLTPAVSLQNRTFGHLRFESSSGTFTPNLNSLTGTGTCNSNDFFIGSNVVMNAPTSAASAQFVVSGNFINNGTMNNAAGFFNFTFSGTSKTISGTVAPVFDTVNVNGSYTMGIGISIPLIRLLTVASGGILDNGGEYQIIGNGIVNINGKFITRDAQGFTGTDAAIPTLAVTLGSSSTVEYGGANQTITAFTTYNNVTVSGTGTKTLLTTPIVMNGDLNVNASTLLINTNEVIEVKKAVKVALNGATFEIRNNGQLVQNDDIVNGANIYNGGNTGNIIYNRTASSIRGYDYVYWSSPVTGQDISTIYSNPSPGFKYFWNPTVSNINTATTGTSGNWEPALGAMTPGKGYIVRGSSSYGMAATDIPAVFRGVPNNGIITAAISRGGNQILSQTGTSGATITNFDDNWNLVGNPYPSAISATEFLKVTNNPNIRGFINLWTHGTAPVSTISPFYSTFAANYSSNDYITYNAAGDNLGPSFGFNGFIGAGQGFFVCMNDGTAGSSTVTFNNSMRNKTHSNSQFFRTTGVQESEDTDEGNRIWLDLVDTNNESVRTLVGYLPEATLGLDRMYDAFKNIANEKNIYSLSEDETLIIQGRPTPFDQNDQVPIGVTILSAGDYKIAIAAVDGLFEQGQPIFLEDKLLNIIHDLRVAPYSFTSAAGIINSRFVLRYTNAALGNPDFGNIENSVIVAGNQGELTIKSSIENIQEVTIYDVLGRQLFFSKEINNTNFVASNISMSQQTLIVKIKLENGMTISRKIIL